MLQVKRSMIALYLLPMVIAISLITLWPIVYTFTISFTNKSDIHLDDYHFVGMKNYQDVLGNLQGPFFQVLFLTILYVVICVALFLLVGMATAMALNNPKVKGLAFWRLLLILPWTLPSAITALIWKYLFNYDFGPIDKLLDLFFGPSARVHWLDTPWTAFAVVVIVNVWLTYPFFTVVILGALQSVPQELNEAAAVDGATAWKRFRYITLPLLRPAVTPATILSAIATFQMLNTVYLITKGGPITSPLKPGTTSFLIVYFYKNVIEDTGGIHRYGALSAVAVITFLILLLLTVLTLRGTNVTREAQA
jgi:arabinogalactan oligomer/maltooligosaccharide transport system permease protein